MSEEPIVPTFKAEHTIDGTPGEQFGLPHLKFQCPRCGASFALAAAGNFICQCGTPVTIREPEKAS